VFGGIAGDTMPRWIAANPGFRPPDTETIDAEVARALEPFSYEPGDLYTLRERLLDCMWNYVGVVRDHKSLWAGLAILDRVSGEILHTGIANADRRFNITWHDWLNLRSLCEISWLIATAALQRENSRGAHYRSDFPEPGDLATSTFTVIRRKPDGGGPGFEISELPVAFTHVKPGETLIRDRVAAE
jgi:fumarate reductase flavoprotein subunit